MNRNKNGKLEFTLQLLAVDFKDTSFESLFDKCAIEKAIERQLGTPNSIEWVQGSTIEGKEFIHERYGLGTFLFDKKQAESLPQDTVIRELVLTEE